MHGRERDLAAQVIDLVAAAAPGAEAEVVVDTTNLALTRFANSFIHQNVAELTTEVKRTREAVQGDGKRSPVEVVLEGLTHRRGR